jgi:outer membrane protein assembly factor BamD
MRRLFSMMWLLPLAACARHSAPKTSPIPQSLIQEAASPATVDSLYRLAMKQVRGGDWADAAKSLQRLSLEMPPSDPRIAQTRLFLGEALLARGDQLAAARTFREVADMTPNDVLAPVGLLRAGDAYAELWRKPDLDPTYGETALATYQELLNRYPESDAAATAKMRIAKLQDDFAYKQYKTALYYLRIKAWDSGILYLKDLVATYPRAAIAPDALIQLVWTYRRLGYMEDVKETCGYIRRFHPDARGVDQLCPVEPAAPAPS